MKGFWVGVVIGGCWVGSRMLLQEGIALGAPAKLPFAWCIFIDPRRSMGAWAGNIVVPDIDKRGWVKRLLLRLESPKHLGPLVEKPVRLM